MTTAEKTWVNNEEPYVEAGAGATPGIADWDPSLVRYIFLDGSAGNDANVGYIDAPAGTVFTPAQTAPVAVRTTHRINQIRPPLGNGRKVVVLVRPKLGGAPYDHLTPGDVSGIEDRHVCSGYALIMTRASDLTNDYHDHQQLAYQTALSGPNTDHSFTIANVLPGNTIVLASTILLTPDSPALTKYRLRIKSHTGAYGDFYTPVKWGDPAAVPNPAAVVAHLSGPYTTGDFVFFEGPAVMFKSFTEATSSVNVSPSQTPALRLYGLDFELGGRCNVGAQDSASSAAYSGNWVGTSFLFCYTTSGTIVFTHETYDESDGYIGGGNFGGWVPSGSVLVPKGDLYVRYSSFADGQGNTTLVGGQSLTILNTAVQYLAMAGTPQFVVLVQNLLGNVTVSGAGLSTIADNKRVPTWATTSITLAPANVGDVAVQFNLADNRAYWGAEPTDPGYTFLPGNYTVEMDMHTGHPGGGASVVIDSNKSIPVTYASLGTTGFKVTNGVTVLCRLSTAGYPGNVLPCPRGVFMQMEPNEGTVDYPVGQIVVVNPITAPLFQLAIASHGAPIPMGVTLTNVRQGIDASFGWAVVSDSHEEVVVRIATGIPVQGQMLFLDGMNPGSAAINPPSDVTVAVVRVGYSLPTGPVAGNLFAITWDPEISDFNIAQLQANRDVTSDATYSDLPGVILPVLAGHVYELAGQVTVNTDAGGSRVCLVASNPGGLDIIDVAYTYQGTSTAPAVAKIFTAFGDPGGVITQVAADGGVWRIQGAFVCLADGTLKVQFGQGASNPVVSRAIRGSYLRLLRRPYHLAPPV
jgi:hypothetical protein